MPLTAGTRIGSYEIIGPLGAGGMGEVYRARDTKLGRDVALKILPDLFADDPDRLARFEREARTLAALNHPNIAHIHGLEEVQPGEGRPGVRALVMELVEGRTLGEHIQASGQRPMTSARGVPLSEALPIARQIAEALEAAHENGIVHRDLKPANIKVTDAGTVKVLDFGLAKALGRDGDAEASGSLATMTSPVMTQAGLILGTAAYMSPEQARGKPVDRRADIWAFGVVLFEMLTGRRLFDGETVSDVVAAVLTRPIDFAELPADVPAGVRALVARCLERDPRRRLRDIGEARIALDPQSDSMSLIGARPSGVTSGIATSVAPEAPRRRAAMLPWIVAIASLAVAAAVGIQRLRGSTASPSAPGRLLAELAPPAGTEFVVGSNVGAIVISPDGSSVAFNVQTSSGRRLHVRTLATGETRAISGSDDGYYPFWSPDSRTLGFFANNKMLTVRIAGGLPEAVADIDQGRGGSWSEAGFILFTPRGGGTISRVAERGGAAQEVTKLDESRGENAHYWPVVLPGGRKFLYFVRSTRQENNGIYLGSLDGTARPVLLVTSLSSGIYAPPATSGAPGHLLWVRDGELLAQPLDIENARLTGDVKKIASDVRVEESQRGLFASVSTDGTLVWASAQAADLTFGWYDRTGRRLGDVPIAPGKIMQARVSPDGTRIVFTRAANGTADIYVHEIASGTTTQVTTDPDYDETPFWSPDGRAIVHQGRVDGVNAVFVTTLDASKPRQTAIQGAGTGAAPYMPDGRAVLVTRGRESGNEIALVRLDRPGEVIPLSTGDEWTQQPVPSPDGQWLAFVSDRAGRSEVVVSRLVAESNTYRLAQRVPVSSEGGVDPEWRDDGREILYLTPNRTVMSVAVTISSGTIALGKPAPLLRVPADAGGSGANWAPTVDHSKFVMVEAPNAVRQTFRLLTRWAQ